MYVLMSSIVFNNCPAAPLYVHLEGAVLEPSIDFMRAAQHHSSMHAGGVVRKYAADSEGRAVFSTHEYQQTLKAACR
jgi:hypothetical protein